MIAYHKLRKEMQAFEVLREKVIRKSRDIIKLSKRIIYAVHRDELRNASSLIKQIEQERKTIEAVVKKDKKLFSQGSYRVAIQEYVEALLYYHFVKSGKLVALPVVAEHFVLGLADLTGELVRRAVFLAGKGEVAKVTAIRDEVDKIYGEMLTFDFRENDIRRKVDGIKYDLRKLEDLVLDMQLRRK